MAEEKKKRKLTAIFSADVKGYSRLMADDEEATVNKINTYRKVMIDLIQRHDGRVVDAKGDNILAEFASVVDAVRCSVEIQKELKERNAGLKDHRRMEFRIGINLGDVIEEGEIIYGDGVNVAARLEGLAEGGGICISGTTFDQIGKKLPLGYEYLGEQSVKNIEKPVRVYRVLTEAEAAGKVIGEIRPKTKQLRGVAIGAVAVLIIVAGALAIWNFYLRPAFTPASVEKMAFPLPDRPSIAVLPFTNLSGDPKQEYLSDGITEQIISGLSKVPKLFVIARQSTFVYKGQPVKIQQVAEELGVRYVMEGSVQKSDNRLRITAQLIDAIEGHHLWAETYDRELNDIFALQDDITMKIMTGMQVKLTLGEQRRILEKGTDNFQAYIKYIQAYEALYKVNREANILARRIVKEAIAQDPGFGLAYSVLGYTHFFDIMLGWSKFPQQSLRKSMELAKKALSLDDSLDCAHGLLGFLYRLKGEYEKAIEETTKAVELAPNSERAHSYLAWALNYAGRSKEAIPVYERAIRLSPFPASITLYGLGLANFFTGRYEEAISACKKAINVTPGSLLPHIYLVAAYSAAGRYEEARAEAEEVLKINPEFSMEYLSKILKFKKQEDKKLIVDSLRKAGLK